MSFCPKISLIIASRDRPEGLRRLLTALRYQFYHNFEVIAVTNLSDTSALRDIPNWTNVRFIKFDEANLSMSRNIGLAAAAGDIVAFCDDDAIPEPTWLTELVTPFQDPEIGISGGYVRGRKGINFQWKAIMTDRFGDDESIDLPDQSNPSVFAFHEDRFAKVQGTNCAFRRDALRQIGGFDTNFHFYLDEVDVVLRLGRVGWKTAIVPAAEVQHGFNESQRRTRNRVPKSLYEEGRSKGYFISRHAATEDAGPSLARFTQGQKNRLVKLMISGWLEPGDITRLLKSLHIGISAGSKLKPRGGNLPKPETLSFCRFHDDVQKERLPGLAIAGSSFNWWRMASAACKEAMSGRLVTVFRFSRMALFHRAYFDSRGFWVQAGGLFGRSEIGDSRFQFWTLRSRLDKEIERVAAFRPLKARVIWRFGRSYKL